MIGGALLALGTGAVILSLLAFVGGQSGASSANEEGWHTCRDEQHGFSLRHPPDWSSTTPEGRCVQLQKGTSTLPEGVPEVDVFIQVEPLRGAFPDDYPRGAAPAGEPPPSTGVQYTNRQETRIGELPAVRAEFRSAGPVPNWGIEYAIQNRDRVLRIYISQPRPDIEVVFDQVVHTLDWPSN